MQFFKSKEECLTYIFDELIATLEEDIRLQNWQAGNDPENPDQPTIWMIYKPK